MAGISEKRVKVIVRTSRKSRKIGQHRITKTTQNQLCPNQRSQVTKMRHQNMPVNCQRVLRADVPVVNGFEARARPRKAHKTMKSSERLTKGPTTKTRYLPSLPWDLRTCVNVEPGYFKSRSWARFSVSAWTCCALAFGVMARDAKVLNSTKVSQSSRRFGGELNGASRRKRPIHPSGIIFCRFFSNVWIITKYNDSVLLEYCQIQFSARARA